MKKIEEKFFKDDFSDHNNISEIYSDLSNKALKNLKNDNSRFEIEKFKYEDLLSVAPKISRGGLSEEKLNNILANYSEGLVRWHAKGTMYNVTPTPLKSSIAARTFFSIYNPNMAWDIAAGKLGLMELEVIKMISNLAGIPWKNSGGAFVFGGKGTNLYGIKVGIDKSVKNVKSKGINGENLVVLSTKASHPCHISCCNWLGIGEENCIRIETDKNGKINLKDLDLKLKQQIHKNKKIVAVMISGGTTMDLVVDPIKEVKRIIDNNVKSFQLDYSPHLHVDSVVGWPWLFFKKYNYEKNLFNFNKSVLKSIRIISDDLNELKYADSFGIDFHKSGFCAYNSSLFIVKDKFDFCNEDPLLQEYGSYTPFKYTIENSRSSDGVVSAYTSLHSLGYQGFQEVLGNLTKMKQSLQRKLEKTGQFKVINKESNGLSVVFIPKNIEESKIEKSLLVLIDLLRVDNKEFFIDLLPSYSTGSKITTHPALKAYIMSPFTDNKTLDSFVELASLSLEKISKKRISKKNSEIKHPLKGCSID